MFLVGDIGNTETKICLLNNRYKKIKNLNELSNVQNFINKKKF